MAARFWVGGTDNWDATVGTKWATTSGGAGGAAVPTSADDVYLDANSGAVTVALASGNRVCQSFDCTGFTGTFNYAGWNLRVFNGAVTFVAGMTVGLGSGGTLSLEATSDNGGTGWPITMAGKQAPNFTLNGVGGKWVLQDALTLSASTATVTLTAGTFDTNGQTCSWGSFSSSNSNARTLTMGASAITLTVAGNAVNCASGTLTITANTATITTTNGNFISTNVSNWNGLSLVLTGNGGRTITPASGGTTFANITRTGAANKTDSVSLAGDIICTGTCTLGGNTTQGVNRLIVQSGTVGTQRTITAAAYVITGDVDFMDINLAYSGGASWTNAGSAYIGDALGNAGAVTTNANVSATQTATGTASFTWSTHGWTSRVPLPQDDVVINNAFVAGRTVTADMPRLGRSIDFTGSTNAPTWNGDGSTGKNIFGSLTLIIGMLLSNWGATTAFRGRSSYTLTSASVSWPNSLSFNAPSGTYSLQDNLQLTAAGGTITNAGGALMFNGKNVECGIITSNSGNGQTIDLGSGITTLHGTGTVLNVNNNSNTFTANAATVIISNTSATSKTVQWPVVSNAPTTRYIGTLQVNAGSGTVNIAPQGGGSNPKIGTLTATNVPVVISGATNNALDVAGDLNISCTTATTLTFNASMTVTITGTFTALGAAGQLLSLVSSTPGTLHAFTVRGTALAGYTSITDCNANSGASIWATNSTNGGNNHNVIFAQPTRLSLGGVG